MLIERHYSVSGIVQGVGFRPLCVRIAHRLNIKGSVSNTSDGVLLKIQGEQSSVERYPAELKENCPDVALIISIALLEEKEIERTDADFIIEKSVRSERQRVLLPPDMAVCADCLGDIKNRRNRRWRYPFTNCTNCGPRFSIVKSLPYDRPCTTMSLFPMCPDCHAEYTDERDRRFHAQPNACPKCGPQLEFCSADGACAARGEEALACAVRALKEGAIIAVKGLGGFHLACRAYSSESVSLLRQRKRRPSRPFAVMVADIAQAHQIAELDDNDVKLLSGTRAPIVLLKKKKSSSLAPQVAPGLSRIGLMLPYTPLHYLLMENMDPLVMTSANMSGDPLVSQNDEAFERLAGICDGFLIHNRPIHMKIDDSVLLHHEDSPIILRRARGYVPNPIIVRSPLAPVIAAGAEMKGTFAFSQDSMIFPSQYLGDVKDLRTAQFYTAALRHFKNLYNFAPKLLVHDSHPLYLSTAMAQKEFSSLPVLSVQHHYAHLMACLAENRTEGASLGLIMDGTGWGTDSTVWGGELLLGDADGFERLGHLRRFRLPGGDRAVSEIWRCGFSLLVETFGFSKALELCARLWPHRAASAALMEKAWTSYPLTSSCGRLFDGFASIVLAMDSVSYDGEAPMLLESLCSSSASDNGHEQINVLNDVIDWSPLVAWAAEKYPPAPAAGTALHAELARSFALLAEGAASHTGITTVALSGGCWQNSLLLQKTTEELIQRGLTPLRHHLLSPNDECISVGQAYIGGLRCAKL